MKAGQSCFLCIVLTAVLASEIQIEADVIIIGLGPVGSFAALALASSDVQNILVFEEKGKEPFSSPRAVLWDDETIRGARQVGGEELEQYTRWHARSMELFFLRDGVSIMRNGPPSQYKSWRLLWDTKEDIEQYVRSSMLSTFPLNPFHQPSWEGELRRQLHKQSGVRVYYNSQVLNVSVVDTKCLVTVCASNGSIFKALGSYCLAADGGSSRTRSSLNLTFGTYVARQNARGIRLFSLF